MIDIHSHVIFGVDDGASSMEESLRMINEAEKLGIKVIIATPHLQDNLNEIDKINGLYQELLEKIKDYNVELKLGYEVFINPFVPKIVKENNDITLNGSAYILIELPFDNIPIYSFETVYNLQIDNIIPIIAHPERNRNFLKHFSQLAKFIESGCLLQVDASSIMGAHGRDVKNFAKRLIKNKLVHFVASDAHSAKGYKDWYMKAYRKVRSWTDEKYAEKLFNTNPKLIIENARESIYEMI